MSGKKIAYPFLFLFLILSGCVPKDALEIINTPVTPSGSTPADAEIIALTPANTPADEITDSDMSLPPLPTLAPGQAEALVNDLLYNDRDCDFPCWLGITPGVTTMTDADRYLSSFATSREEGISNIRFSYDEVKEDFYIALQESIGQGIVDWISAPNPYKFQDILRRLGEPDEIWVNFILSGYGEPRISLFLDYSSKGLVITYGNISDVEYTRINNDTYIQLCNAFFEYPNTGSGMMIWGNDNDEDFSEFYHSSTGFILKDQQYVRISDVSDFTPQDFYDAFSTSESGRCFDFAMNEWPWE